MADELTDFTGKSVPEGYAVGARPELIDSIIYNESRRNPNAVSNKGAVGLMQVEPATAKDYGVTNPDDLKNPEINRRVGTAYFNDLLKKNGGDERKALIAYNQGPNRKGLASGTAEYADAVLKGASDTSGGLKDFTGTSLPKGYKVGGPLGDTEISAGASPGYEKNWFDTHTENLAQHAYNYLDKKGHPELAAEMKDLISGFLPHSATEAATQAVATVLPGVGKLAPAVKESAPLLAKAMEATSAPGLKGAVTRAAVTGGVGAATGGVPGAMQGALASGAGDVASSAAGHAAGVNKVEGQMMGAAAPVAAEEQAQGAVERRLGMTMPQAQALAAPPVVPTQATADLQSAKTFVREGRTAARKDVSALYDPIYQPVDQMPVTPEHLDSIGQASKDSMALLGARGQDDPLNKRTRDLLDEFSAYGSKKTGTAPSPHTAESIRAELGETGPQPGGAPSFTDSAKAKRELSENLFRTKGGDLVTPGAPDQPITIGQLRGRNQELTRAMMAAGPETPAGAALARAQIPIKEALESVLTDEQKPIVRSIDGAYAAVINRFPGGDMTALRKAGTLPEFGKAFAELPIGASDMVLDRMSPDQKALIRKAYSSYMLSEGATGKDIFNALEGHSKSGLLAKMGFADDFQQVKAWRDVVTNGRKIYNKPPDLLQSSEFLSGVRKGLRDQGVTPELLDRMNREAAKDAARGGSRFQRYATNAAIFSSLGALSVGYGAKRAAVALPIVLGYYARQAALDNPAYVKFIMNGYTRLAGEAFARFTSAGLVNDAQRYAAESGTLRPDKEREAEAMRP